MNKIDQISFYLAILGFHGHFPIIKTPKSLNLGYEYEYFWYFKISGVDYGGYLWGLYYGAYGG